MTNSRNHHYVSQVIIKKFVSQNTGKYFLYDKINKRYSYKQSPKSIFYLKDLNTLINQNGQIDYNSVEEELSKKFENQYNSKHEKVVKAIESRNMSEISENLELLLMGALISNFKTPAGKASNDLMLNNLLLDLGLNKKKNTFIHFSRLSEYQNSYFKLAKDMLELMGDIVISIYTAPADCYYFLSDTHSANLRIEEVDTIVEKDIEYVQRLNPVSLAMFPINSRYLIVCQSKRSSPIQESKIYSADAEMVKGFNRVLYNLATSTILCENKDYLSTFINNDIQY
jgi:Protein of unknown function (DUF4238)